MKIKNSILLYINSILAILLRGLNINKTFAIYYLLNRKRYLSKDKIL